MSTTNYIEELHNAVDLLKSDSGEKIASENSEASQEKIASPETETCTDLADELLKVAAEMRGDTPKGGAPADSETASSLGEATGVSEEELKRRMMERLRKKKEQSSPEKGEAAEEEGGEGEKEEKEAAAYETLPPNSPVYPDEARKLMAEAPSIELTEQQLKRGLAAFAANKAKKSMKSDKSEKSDKS